MLQKSILKNISAVYSIFAYALDYSILILILFIIYKFNYLKMAKAGASKYEMLNEV